MDDETRLTEIDIELNYLRVNQLMMENRQEALISERRRLTIKITRETGQPPKPRVAR